jgi:hypothetical protein
MTLCESARRLYKNFVALLMIKILAEAYWPQQVKSFLLLFKRKYIITGGDF